jgi:hypothetical protein
LEYAVSNKRFTYVPSDDILSYKMTGVLLFAVVAAALLLALYWLSRRAKVDHDAEQLLRSLSPGEILPHHYRYFPQVRQALSDSDAEFLRSRAAPETQARAQEIRRGIALEYLGGLRDDYKKFDRLARALTALAPAANPQREMERIRLSLRFGWGWRIVWLRLWIGATPLSQIQALADQIGSVSTRLEDSIKTWQEGLAASRAEGLKT